MKTPPHRIALVVLIVLVLAGAGMWWRHSTDEQVLPLDNRAMASPAMAAMDGRVRGSPRGTSTSDPPDQCSKAIRDAFNVRARALAQREDASSQLAYALAMPFEEPDTLDRKEPAAMRRMFDKRATDEQRAFLRAVELAPGRADILFIAATRCGYDEACRGMQALMLESQSDNMAGWVYEMSWARIRNEPDASERAFANAAKAKRDDVYDESALKVLVEAYGDMPMPVECASDAAKAAMRRETGMDHDFSMLDQALLLSSASLAGTMPGYNDLRLRCNPQSNVTMGAATRASCRNILTRMADGDRWVGRLVALGTMVQLAADDPDALTWRERYRGDRWMMAQRAESDVQRLLKSEDYVVDEAGAAQAALEALGRWPPPANWLPDDEYSRSLIQTGQPPPPKTR